MLTIKGQMIADVPLGAFLSGGIDSSAIVAFMQRQSTQPVRTFSIGFHETKYNEADYAARVAKHLGTAHTELYVTPGEMQEVVPLLAQLYDEPFSDSSQIPTYLVSKIARRGVTVSLSGDGGDELFGGYSRYLWGERVWRYLESLPGTARGIIATLIKAIGEKRWDWIYDNFKPLLPRSLSFQKFGYKILRLAMVLGQPQRENLYRELVTHWDDASGLVLGSKPALSAMTDPRSWPADLSFIESMMFLDLVSYLPDDILVKVDRASMGVSLESRAPFLDHRLVEFIWSLPMPWKFHKRGSKHLLRQLLYRYVPAALIERPKMGFGVPIDSWLRGPLKEWAEDLLDQERIKQSGYLDAGVVAEKWAEHSSGRRDWGYHLWDVLMFQNWLSEYQH